MDQRLGFLAALRDFSFCKFITTRVIKVLYGVGVILIGLSVIGMIITGFTGGSIATAVVKLILSPLIFLLAVIVLRVYLELILVVFRIEQNTQGLKKTEP